MNYAILTDKLTKNYGKNRGINELDLKVEEGDFFGFIGPNGAGKSTTIRTLLGLIRPTSGGAKVLGYDIMYKGLLAKANMMKRYPDMGNFTIKAYYEKDPEVAADVHKVVAPYTKIETNSSLPPLDASKFKDGLDLKMMYQDMYLASEGYLWRMQQNSKLDIDKMVSDYEQIINFWKSLYLK